MNETNGNQGGATATQDATRQEPRLAQPGQAQTGPAQAGPRDRGCRPSNVKLAAGTPLTVRSTEWEGDRGGSIVRMEAPGIARVRVDLDRGVDKALIGQNGGSPTLQIDACSIVAGFDQVAGGFKPGEGRKTFAAVEAVGGELMELEGLSVADREVLDPLLDNLSSRIESIEKQVPENFKQVADEIKDVRRLVGESREDFLKANDAVAELRESQKKHSEATATALTSINELRDSIAELKKRVDALTAKPAADKKGGNG